MTSAPRNPYLILGIPFGATKEQATRAFARQSKLVRAGRSPHETADLTWALSQVENVLAQPGENLDLYRVPVDPKAFEHPPIEVPNRAATPLARRTSDSGEILQNTRESAVRTLLLTAIPSTAPAWPSPSILDE